MAKLVPPSTLINGEINREQLLMFQQAFDAEPRYRQSMNAVCVNPASKVALNRRTVSQVDHSFSHHLTEGKATAQNASGRCWLFAALNTMRIIAMEKMNLPDDFELSQNYLSFWDKLEKANYFLESILQTLDEPNGSRLIDFLLVSPIQDGGQWHMFVNLVRKYGIVPKRAMPETDSSGGTAQMNSFITGKLREYACRLRSEAARGTSYTDLREMKHEMLESVYRMLVIHLGEPPREFDWQWRDKDKNFHRDGMMTPQAFYQKYIATDLDDMVCLIHCPQKSKEYNTLYTIKFLGNVVGGEIIKYLNVELDVLKRATIEQIMGGQAVWFGCDVGKHLDRDLGVLDLDLFDYELLYGTKMGMDKAQRLDYGHSQMTHAMVFTGVDLDEREHPRRWRVENSWGDKGGDKGFLVMSDPWFDEYVYEVVVRRKYVSEALLKVLETEPVPLEPWDPMGALAVAE